MRRRSIGGFGSDGASPPQLMRLHFELPEDDKDARIARLEKVLADTDFGGVDVLIDEIVPYTPGAAHLTIYLTPNSTLHQATINRVLSTAANRSWFVAHTTVTSDGRVCILARAKVVGARTSKRVLLGLAGWTCLCLMCVFLLYQAITVTQGSGLFGQSEWPGSGASDMEPVVRGTGIAIVEPDSTDRRFWQ